MQANPTVRQLHRHYSHIRGQQPGLRCTDHIRQQKPPGQSSFSHRKAGTAAARQGNPENTDFIGRYIILIATLPYLQAVHWSCASVAASTVSQPESEEYGGKMASSDVPWLVENHSAIVFEPPVRLFRCCRRRLLSGAFNSVYTEVLEHLFIKTRL